MVMNHGKDKGKGIWDLGVVKCWKANIWGKLTEDKGYLVRWSLCRVISVPRPSPVIKVIDPFLVQETGASSQEKLALLLGRRGREDSFSCACFF